MTIPTQVIAQRDFSAGENDPDAARRDDTEFFKFGVAHARNLQFLKTAGLEQRPGRRWLYNDDGVREEFHPFPDVVYSVTFAASRVTIRNEDGAKLADLSAPWGAAIVDQLVWEPLGNQIYVCGPGIRVQIIEVDETTRAWSIRPFQFETGINGKLLAPFYRFGAKGVTMQPSDVAGSITVTMSGDVFSPGHIGEVFRYAGRQLVVTTVIDARTVIASVLEELPPTYEIALDDVAGFAIGEIVQCETSNMEGEIVGINAGSNYLVVVATDRYFGIETGEKLIGPNADGTVSSFSVVAPGATVQWDEIFMSDFRGWPQSVSTDSQRLIMCDFPQFKQAILWSAVSGPADFEIGADATDAIFEYVQAECRVYHVVGGYDEFAITDSGVYYIPISANNPLVPGSVEFRIIYTDQVARVRPLKVTEGVLFVDATGSGIYAISATGQTARPYVAEEITEFRRHLFNNIRVMATTTGTADAKSRQIFAVNGDGTVVIGQYNSARGYVGWLKWDGEGYVQSVSGRYGKVVFSTVYPLAVGVAYVAEQLDVDQLLDCALTFPGGSFANVLHLSTDEPLTFDDGALFELEGLTMAFLAGATVSVLADGFYLGPRTVAPDGSISVVGDFETVTVGRWFDWSLTPNLPSFEGGENFGQRLKRRKIGKVMISVRDTQEFQCGNRLLAGYLGGDDTGAPMPKRTATYRSRQIGRSYDPSYTLSRTFPGTFKLLELTTEITV